MNHREVTIDYGDGIWTIRRFTVDKGELISFVVQLFLTEEGNDYEIIRYDSWDGIPHKHTFYKKPPYDRTNFEYHSKKEVMNLAILDLEENYEYYIECYKNKKKR